MLDWRVSLLLEVGENGGCDQYQADNYWVAGNHCALSQASSISITSFIFPKALANPSRHCGRDYFFQRLAAAFLAISARRLGLRSTSSVRPEAPVKSLRFRPLLLSHRFPLGSKAQNV